MVQGTAGVTCEVVFESWVGEVQGVENVGQVRSSVGFKRVQGGWTEWEVVIRKFEISVQ